METRPRRPRTRYDDLYGFGNKDHQKGIEGVGGWLRLAGIMLVWVVGVFGTMALLMWLVF